MKKILMTLMLLGSMTAAMAQAQIKFEKTTHNFGTFSENEPKVTCTFTYTNVGDQPLVINQAIASCGCTVPEYTKTPVQPGEKGEIKVTYNGAGKFPGHFKKSITIRTNGSVEITRLYIEGDMTEAKN
jgi:endonuclease YncB( thermonuclease family)